MGCRHTFQSKGSQGETLSSEWNLCHALKSTQLIGKPKLQMRLVLPCANRLLWHRCMQCWEKGTSSTLSCSPCSAAQALLPFSLCWLTDHAWRWNSECCLQMTRVKQTGRWFRQMRSQNCCNTDLGSLFASQNNATSNFWGVSLIASYLRNVMNYLTWGLSETSSSGKQTIQQKNNRSSCLRSFLQRFKYLRAIYKCHL